MDEQEQYKRDMEVWRKGVHKYERSHLAGWAINVLQTALLVFLTYHALTR